MEAEHPIPIVKEKKNNLCTAKKKNYLCRNYLNVGFSFTSFVANKIICSL